MSEQITLAPPNSIILIMDHAFGKLPDSMNGDLIAFTDSCVAVGTLSEDDGETTILLVRDYRSQPGEQMAFNSILQTPNKELSVVDVNNKKLLTIKVTQQATTVNIFVDDLDEPSKIVVSAN